MTATKIQPGNDTHLTLLMAPHSLNFVTGADRAALLAYGRDVFAAGREAKCLAQIQEPAQPTYIVLDDRWKARILDGRALERDDMGLGDHPELPQLDEGMKPRGFFAALGLELSHTFAEDQLDGDALEAMGDAVNWTAWQPTPPQGDGWKLVAIFDTEDGPAAWWLRELAEAEDGTTTIRNLQAEIEKLKARMARVSRAGAAPVDVAGPASGGIDWDVLPEDPSERAMFDRNLQLLYRADPRIAIATSLAIWAKTHGNGSFGAMCAVFANEIAKMHIAAPALEAPAAPVSTYVEVRECSDCGHVGINDTDGSKAACNTCDWQGGSPREDKCPDCDRVGTMTSACPECGARTSLIAETHLLAAAPQAPAAPVGLPVAAWLQVVDGQPVDMECIPPCTLPDGEYDLLARPRASDVAAPAAPAVDALAPVQALLDMHAELLDANPYAYFELAYTRQTGWMAWIAEKPMYGAQFINHERKVLARGQGDTPAEACAAAAQAAAKGEA